MRVVAQRLVDLDNGRPLALGEIADVEPSDRITALLEAGHLAEATARAARTQQTPPAPAAEQKEEA